MSGMFGTKSPKATKPTPINGLQVQTSSYGLPVALRYGRNRGAGQLIDWQGFRAVEHAQKQKTGGKGGSKSSTQYSYTYNVTPLLALGEGPLTAINRVWKEDAVQTLAQSGFTFFTGSWTQTPWSYMTSKFPTHARAYIGTAYLGGADLDLGDTASLPNYNFDISGLLYVSGKPGAKPGAIISDYLTHSQHGAGFNYVMSFTGSDFESYCLARGIYLSPFEETQRPASAFVKDIADACNAGVVWSQRKLKLIPYADETIVGADGTYTPNLTPLYDITEDDYLASSAGNGTNGGYVIIEQKALEQAYNHIQLEIVDGDNDFITTIVEAKDQADIDARGLRSKAVVQRHDITDVDVGRDVAQMMLQRELYIINTFTFKLTVRHSLIDLMDPLTINDAVNGLEQQLVRVQSVEEEDDGVTIEAEEVLANANHAPKYSTQKGAGYLPDMGVDPGNPEHVQLINAPTLLCPSPGYELWIAAASTNQNWGGAQVWISTDNSNYELAGMLTGPSRIGTLTATLPAWSPKTVTDDTNTLHVAIDRGYLFPGLDADRDEFRTICYIAGNGGEFLAYRDANLTGTLAYDLMSLARGGYGTSANSHAAGSTFVRLDDCVFRLPYDEGMANKTLYVKLLSYNVYGQGLQSLADVTARSIVLKPNTGNGPVRNGDATITGLDSKAQSALDGVTDIATDSKLTAGEKVKAKALYNTLTGQQSGLDTTAAKVGCIDEMNAYDTAMQALKDYLRTNVGVLNGSNVWTGTTGTTAIDRATWDSKWGDVFGTRQLLRNAISNNNYDAGMGSGNLCKTSTYFNGAGTWRTTSNSSVGVNPNYLNDGYMDCTYTGTNDGGGNFDMWERGTSIPVRVGQVLFVACRLSTYYGAAGGFGLIMMDKNGSILRYAQAASKGAGSANTSMHGLITVQSGEVFARPWVFQTTPAVNDRIRWTEFDVRADTLMQPGYGSRIADAKNLQAIVFANYASGWSGLTLSTSTTSTNCTISASAGTLRAGSVSIAYNASSTSVAGSAGQTKTLYLYYDDGEFDGGSQTLRATTSLITALSNDYRVLLGSVTVTYPTSGTSSGGGGGPCPDEDAWVLMCDPLERKPDWLVQAKDVKVGDWLRDTDGLPVEVTGSERKRANRHRVYGRYGYSVTCSSIAPLELASWLENVDPGTCLAASMCEGRALRIRNDGHVFGDVCTRTEDMGEGWVQHISCHDRRFWIGDHPRHLFGHHNLKPLSP